MIIDQKMVSKSISPLNVKHFLMVSLAINVGLFLCFFYEGGKGVCTVDRQLEKISPAAAAGNDNYVNVVKNEDEICHKSQLKMEISSGAGAGAASGSTSVVHMRAKDDGKSIINLDHGDPTMYEDYWRQMGEKATLVIPGWQGISYFSDKGNICWFLEPAFANAITRLHKMVGNAITEDRHIVVGTGSSQLFNAVLYALCSPDLSEPMDVVSAAPFYSSYPLMTDFQKSGLHKWAGDAYKYDKDKPYIELVTSPNNPDGSMRQSVVNGSEGILVHDLAYYWPQYTPITSPADHDIMLFTVSKATGHAGSRIGWALVKDKEIAKRMTKYMEISTIGVSKDSQLRAAKILDVIFESYDQKGNHGKVDSFFEYGYNHMTNRWRKLREAVDKGELFSLPDFESAECTFSGRIFEQRPAFAWLKCEGEIEDCEKFLRGHNIIARNGKHFGFSSKYVRISMLDRDEMFDHLTERLAKINLENPYV